MKTRTGRTVKLSAKNRDARSLLGQKFISAKQSSEIKDFVILLTHILWVWEEDNINAMGIKAKESESI